MDPPPSPFTLIMRMASSIVSSGLTGPKGSKAEAEEVVRGIIGPADRAFQDRFGMNYWGYLKAILNEYVSSRGLEGSIVVKGSPFNYHGAVGTSCSAVMLRKDFHKGEAHVEPELFLEVGLVRDRRGNVGPGVSCGFHYLSSPEGDRSRFVQWVLDDEETKALAWGLSTNGFLNPTFRSEEAKGHWGMDSVLVKTWGEGEVPPCLQERVFAALDELLPLFLRISSAASIKGGNSDRTG